MVINLDNKNLVTRVRHPEKVNKEEIVNVQKKPSWIRVKAPNSAGYRRTKKIVKDYFKNSE